MRKSCILFLFIFSCCLVANSQDKTSSKPVTKEDFLLKSKRQKTGGFVLLGIGALAIGVAAEGNVSFGDAGILVVVGGLAVVGSITLFLASARNKKKAAALSFINIPVPIPQKMGVVSRNMPGISLSLRI